ncbi:PREDICTED: sulfotransferase 1 family member D1-like isoform X1 [Cercocebus atys]|uniref:sulfotransferase 1 family member D1-like isoform X1 n=1 Tax=Cercocebus atys TaxID=9531 RepID=UPI0005F3E2E1|nr:PREDICTED: sulfotransferase 1 family member D1-like isoform X1 [Cercocebus atys]
MDAAGGPRHATAERNGKPGRSRCWPCRPRVPVLQEKNDCRIIYMAWNAKDVAVSYYFYQLAKMHPEPESWEEFLNKFMAVKVCFGFWYDYTAGRRGKGFVSFTYFYEDMKENSKCGIQKRLNRKRNARRNCGKNLLV